MITFNDISINIKIIDDKDSHYQLNIPNNEANKKLIENTVFKFEKSGTQTIIMYDDIHIFQLSKMECNYSEFIEIKEQMEHLKKENDILKQDLSKNEKEIIIFKNELLQQMKNDMVNFKNELFDINNLLQKQIEKVNGKSIEQFNNDLQQQINSTSYYLPVVFISHYGKHQVNYYGDEQWIHELQHVLTEHQMILLRGTNLRIAFANQRSYGTSLNKIIIPQKKTVILFKKSIEIYSSGIYNNIEGCRFFWCGKEDDKDEFINTLKNIGYNCDNIINVIN